MKITIIAGARPNFMKIAPLAQAIMKAREAGKKIEYRLVYTGKENDSALGHSLFTDLNLSYPDTCLGVESADFFERMAGIMVAFARDLEAHPTDLVLVVDDMTPTMACTIVAKKKGIRVAHLIAGTRSFDIDMPKEVNRMITDGLSDYFFTAGMHSNRNLNQTGTKQSHVYFVGNILIDTLRHNLMRFTCPTELQQARLTERPYLLLTLNRHTLLNNEEVLQRLFNTLLQKSCDLPIIAPVHDYVAARLRALHLDESRVHLLAPQSYLAFGYLESHAKGIITDSGNVAEEATFLGIPCITLNDYSEHPETITIGTNILIGEDAEALGEALQTLCKGEWKKASLPERWDGRTAERIVQILEEQFT